MFTPFRFDNVQLPPSAQALRGEVRAFLQEHRGGWPPALVGHSWTGVDRSFSLEVGARGWIGMTWPRQYGGHERSMLERYIVIEEMLVVGAPVGSHWIADRQSGPLILRVGTEEQRRRYLPPITRGESSFCIGLSEPDSGSDLASLRTRADRDGTGWRLNGRKIWTTNAHQSQYMIAIVRTSGGPEERHKGLSQFIVDLSLPGISVREINDLTTGASFNEVTFDDVALGSDALLGLEGDGWAQVNAELAFERSGPDRYLSSFPILPKVIDRLARKDATGPLEARAIGTAFAELAVLREMSISVAGMLERGENPAQEAAVVKELGVGLEQRFPDLARSLAPADPDDADGLDELVSEVRQMATTYSLRGGTREIIRGIMARGLGLR